MSHPGDPAAVLVLAAPVEIAWMLSLAALGRVVLAWFPPGRPGGHAWRELPVTLAASALLGASIFGVASACGVHWFVLAMPAIALGLLAIVAAPRALVPRHEPALAREPPIAQLLLLVVAAALIVGCAIAARALATTADGDPPQVVAALLFAPFVLWGLETARCSVLVRAAALAALGAVAWSSFASGGSADGLVSTLFGATAAGAIAWYRRADERALVLAIVLCAGLLCVERGAWPLGAAGLLALVLGSAAPARPRVALLAAGATLAGLLLRAGGDAGVTRVGPPALPTSAPYLIVVLFVPVLLAWWYDARRIRVPSTNPSGAPIGHERAWLLRMVLLALFGAYATRWSGHAVRFDVVAWPALYVLVLAFGLALERVAVRA